MRVFDPEKSFKPSVIFWVRPGPYNRVEHLKFASLGRARPCPQTLKWTGKAC